MEVGVFYTNCLISCRSLIYHILKELIAKQAPNINDEDRARDSEILTCTIIHEIAGLLHLVWGAA
jgi:hypothetical protein